MYKNLLRTALLSVVAAAEVGCAVGPHYRAPQPAPVTLHSADSQLVTQQAFDPQWWKQLEDPVLDGLIVKTLSSNNNIRIAQLRLIQSRATYDERKLDRYPVAPLDASYQYQKATIPGFTGDRRTINTFRAGFDAFWEADLFGAVRNRMGAARAESQAIEADLRNVQVSIVAELARNYFELRGAQWRLAVADRSLANQRESLRLTQLRRDAGVGEEQDVASAAARVAATEATIPSLQAEAARAEFRIAVLVGIRPGELTADLTPRQYAPIAKPLPLGSPGELLQRRPDVRTAERRLAAATALQGVARANYFPQVSITGFVGILAGRGSLFATSDSRAWSVGPGLSWTGFDLARTRAQYRGASAATDEAFTFYEVTVLRALEETENALVTYRTQQRRLIKLNDQASESKRAADIARLRYREGVIDFLLLLDAERTQLQAEDEVAAAESGVYVSVISIYKALGGMPDDAAQASAPFVRTTTP